MTPEEALSRIEELEAAGKALAGAAEKFEKAALGLEARLATERAAALEEAARVVEVFRIRGRVEHEHVMGEVENEIRALASGPRPVVLDLLVAEGISNNAEMLPELREALDAAIARAKGA